MQSTDKTNPLAVIADHPRDGAADEDLGRRMGRDARRVSRGELTAAEFHDRYHDAVVAEFGFDDRPTGGER